MGGGGLITADVLFCLQGNRLVTQWGRFSFGGGGAESS